MPIAVDDDLTPEQLATRTTPRCWVVLSEHLPNPSPQLIAAWKWLKTHPDEDERPLSPSKPLRILQQHRRLSLQEEQAVIKAYQSGLTVYQVGKLYKIHRTSVSAIMRRHGQTMRRSTG